MSQAIATKSLDKVLDPAVEYFSRAGVLTVFGISLSTLTGDLTCLGGFCPQGFNHVPNSKSFDHLTLEVMWRFRQLIEMFGYERSMSRQGISFVLFYLEKF